MAQLVVPTGTFVGKASVRAHRAEMEIKAALRAAMEL